ncbi:MAG TPA: deoxyguanosinetriphosphate triphosphohydrolase [Acetomicrobium sp.]|nr:deoxyguanosinetriphosphate triphosphohydrolase [Acetomicrobium sp.]
MTPRITWETIERQLLADFASKSADSKGRKIDEPPCPIRTCYQRDRDRIIHCKAFRRLKYKTQVLPLPEGDHYRTRLTHTLEVSQIARTIARALRLNEDLTEAIALGHDLGHTPFGHMGEEVLDELAKENGLNGFHHAEQSLRIVDSLEGDGKGLNLTWEVREGILQHSKGQVDVHEGLKLFEPSTYEAWVVRVSDSIAYLNHDLDDAIRARLVSIHEVPEEVIGLLGDTHSKRIGTLVTDVVNSSGQGGIYLSDAALGSMELLRSFLYERVYLGPQARKERPKVKHVLSTIFHYLLSNPHVFDSLEFTDVEANAITRVIDFISGMTDRYAMAFFGDIAVPTPWPLDISLSDRTP